VLVNPKPIPGFSFTNPNCLGSAVQYTDQSTTVTGYVGPIVTWQWDFNDGSVIPPINWPATPNILHTFLGQATSHTVRLTITTSTGCVAFIEHVVTSVPSPLVDFSFPPVVVQNSLSSLPTFRSKTEVEIFCNGIGILVMSDRVQIMYHLPKTRFISFQDQGHTLLR